MSEIFESSCYVTTASETQTKNAVKKKVELKRCEKTSRIERCEKKLSNSFHCERIYHIHCRNFFFHSG